MKVIHVIFTFLTGGSETMLVDIVKQQCKEVSVSLIIINDKVNGELLDTIDKRVNIFPLKRKEGNKIQLLRIYFEINRIVNRINPDIIHCHDNKLFPFFIKWRKKLCLTVHNVNLSHSFLKYYSKVFVISTAVQKDIKKRTGIEARIVFNGIEIDRYISRINYDFNPEKDEFKLVQVSRLFPEQKGQHIAIRSMEYLKKQHPGINIKLYFVGDGDALPELEKLAIECNVREQLVFSGSVSRDWIKNNLQHYHLLIQPSLFEGFGLTIIEGFASGLPVIASDLDGPKEIIEHLNNGILVQPNDPIDLADKIRQIYESYLSNKLQESNFVIRDKSRLKIFDIQTTAKKYLSYYRL
jgi:glycosyltransferase involved in cell wall biosynthesis